MWIGGDADALSKRKRALASLGISVALAEKWTTQDPSVYFLSEKLDGMRCVWDGGRLWTRNGNPVCAPPWFVATLPANITLDGELFLGRGRFQECMSIVRCQTPDEAAWEAIRYMVFDAPRTKGTFVARLKVGGGGCPQGLQPGPSCRPNPVSHSRTGVDAAAEGDGSGR